MTTKSGDGSEAGVDLHPSTEFYLVNAIGRPNSAWSAFVEPEAVLIRFNAKWQVQPG